MTQSTVLVFLQVILFSTQVNCNNQFEPPDLFSVLRSCCTFGKQLANPGRQFGTCSDFQVPIPNVPLEFQACHNNYKHQQKNCHCMTSRPDFYGEAEGGRGTIMHELSSSLIDIYSV